MSNEEYHKPFGPEQSGNGRYYGEQYRGETLHEEHSEDEIDLKQLISVMLRHKWSIISITFVAGLIAIWIAFAMLPVYQSDGTLIIAESQNRYSYAGSDISNLLSSTYGLGMGSSLANELQVLKSRRLSEALAERVISEDVMPNGKRFPILWYEFPEDSTIVEREVLARRIRTNMQIERVERDAHLIRITFESFSPFEAEFMVNEVIDTYTELSTDQHRIAANSALRFLENELENVTVKLNETEQRLRQYMDNTGLVQIDNQTSSVISRITSLEGQRQEMQVRKVAISSAIEQYEQQINDVRPGLADQYAESFGPTMERYQFQLAELTTERLLLLERNPQLRQNPDQEPYLVELNDRIDLMKREINKLASELTKDDGREVYLGMLSSTGDGGIASRLTEIRGKLIELQIEEAQIAAQEEVINRRLEQENQFIDELPENMVEFARLRRDADITEQLYLTISQQYSETALWEQTQFGLGRPLDYAFLPQRPSKPNKKLILLAGLFFGGIFSTSLAFGREFLNRTIDGSEKVRKAGYPLLSVIPEFGPYIKNNFNGQEYITVQGKKVSTGWVSLLDSMSPASESFRRLHNNIIYSHPDQNFQTILITSTGKGEGKTTTATNLAIALSEAGKRVLIIDSDLRRPALHKTVGETQSPGLMEMVFDDIPEEDTVRQSVAPNVYVLTAGRRPPNPSSVMQSKKLRDKIEELKTKFDHVIIDSAPYGIITDAAPMMRLADGVVLVVRFGTTQTNELNQTIENLKRVRVNIIGTVLMAYDHESSTDYYYTSQYSYYNYKQYEEYVEKS